LTYALNAVNRSMGRDDLYPFVLAPAVIDKLAFVHQAVSRTGTATNWPLAEPIVICCRYIVSVLDRRTDD
jgi:hypothetical protein